MLKGKLLGLFGGTFDPIHLGHTVPVQQCAERLAMQQVCIIPCHIPPHKQKPGIDPSHRLNMVKLAVEDNALFKVDDFELKQHKASYSLHTLEHYRQKYPGQHLCFFIGMDSLLNFNLWYRWQDILQLCHLIVCHRPGYDPTAIPQELEAFLCKTQEALHQFQSGRILLQQVELVDISSTTLREQIQNQQPSPYLQKKVDEYIRQHGLYSC